MYEQTSHQKNYINLSAYPQQCKSVPNIESVKFTNFFLKLMVKNQFVYMKRKVEWFVPKTVGA